MNYQTHVKSESLLRFWDIKDWAPVEILSRCLPEYSFSEIHCESILMKLWPYNLKKNTAKLKKYQNKLNKINQNKHSKTKNIKAWTVRGTALSRGETKTNSHKAHLPIATTKDDPDTTQTQRILNSAAAWKIKHCTKQSIALQQIHLCCISYSVWAKQIELQPLHQ